MMKNYTSNVAPARSIQLIESLLVKAGAKNIMKTYESCNVVAISFVIMEPVNCRSLAIKLPANVQGVEKYLRAQRSRSITQAQARMIREQAERTAWKLILDWVEIQISMIELKQAELLQVFLPYVCDVEGRSLYETMRESNFAALPAPKEAE